MKKNLVRIGALVAVVLIAAGAWRWYSHRAARAAAAPRYETAPVTRGRIAATVTASGTLSPLVTVQIGSQISGRVQALYADFNSHVKKGQVIARIDPSVFESQVEQARANEQMAIAAEKSAQAAAVDARQQHQRTASLVAKGLAAQAEADTALAKLQSADADVASAKAKIAQMRAARVQAETNLSYTTITSPIDGVVISRDVDVGQTVAASLQAPLLFTLAEDLRKMEVHTDVAESDVGRVRDGMPVEFTVDAYPGEHFKGTVKAVRYSPKTVQNVVTYDAVVSVENSALKLRPGMTADVSFTVDELDDALLVPNAALRFRPPDAPGAAAAAGAAPGARPGGGNGVTRGPQGAGAAAGSERATRGPGGQGGRGGPGAGGAGAGAPGVAAGDAPHRSRRAVWVLADDGTIRAVAIQTGPSDGRNTAVVAGDLADGARVVTGIAAANGANGGATGQNRGGRPGFGRFL